MNRFFLLFIALVAILPSAWGGEFFEVQKIDYLARPPRTGPAVYVDSERPLLDRAGKPTGKMQGEFIPCLAVRVMAQDQIKASNTIAKAYFYDRKGELMATVYLPSPTRLKPDMPERPARPVFYPAAKPEMIFFSVPPHVYNYKEKWTAVVIFGDKKGVHAAVYPTRGMVTGYDFPEKELYANRGKAGARKAFMNPLIEHVVKTHVPEQPQITLFLRPPPGMTDASEAKGVLAMCIIANHVEDIRRRLQAIDGNDELGGLLQFAQRHRLVIICWGSRTMRQPGTTWDEIDRNTNARMEKIFDEIAGKWDEGIQELVRQYGLPENQFLLWGHSDAGQYSGRLAIRKPNRFLAVHCHIPNGFDAPRLEGNKVLWLITTGELDFCYERSLRFLSAARSLGYPIIYKAIIGLDHKPHPAADRLGLAFFEWALQMKEQREALDKSLQDRYGRPIAQTNQEAKPWPKEFENPPFIGDVVNQEMYPADKSEMVPAGFRVALPTKVIAQIWNME